MTLEKHKAPLQAVFNELLQRVMELPLVKEMGAKVNHMSVDKLNDAVGQNYYIGVTVGEKANKINKIDFSNISITPCINNPSTHGGATLSDEVRAQLIQLGELSRDAEAPSSSSPTLPDKMMEAIKLVKTELPSGKRVRYGSNELAKSIGLYLKYLCNCAKSNQKERNRKKGRSFKELTPSDVLKLKMWVLREYVATGGLCSVSGLPLSFTDPNRKVSIDRLDNDVGYEEESNCALVHPHFQTELTQSSHLQHLKWTREMFIGYGARILKGEATVKYVDLPLDVREKLESEWADRVPEPFDPSAAGPRKSRKRRVEEVEEEGEEREES